MPINTIKSNMSKFLSSSTVVLFSAITIGCSNSYNDLLPGSTQDVAPSTLEGVWEMRGYGRELSIEENVVSDFQITRNTCWLSAEIFPHELDSILTEVELSLDQRVFNTKAEHVPDHAHAYTFTKLDALPETCNDANIVTAIDDPTVNYDVLWNTLNDYYAFFDLRGVDWDATDTMARPFLSQVVEDEELFEIFKNMLQPLEDGHVGLTIEEAGVSWSAGIPPVWLKRVFAFFDNTHPQAELQNAFEMQVEFDNHNEFVDTVFTQFYEELVVENDKNIKSYFNNLSCGANDHICWGVTQDNVGYLSVDAMEGYSSESDEQDNTEDLSIINTLLNDAFVTLSTTEVLIVDIRQNQGGQDNVSLDLAGRFSQAPWLAFHKQARNKNSVANQHDIHITPTGENQYSKPVYLLTSGSTYSAADVFALAMRGLSHVTLVGEPTGGIFSDAIGKELTNGWRFTVSTEIYSDTEGNVFEGVGVPVDYFVDNFTPEEIYAGHDTAIETALDLIATQSYSQ